MNYNLEIQKILLQCEGLSNPEDKINRLKQAIQLADVNNDVDWGYELRLNLISEETNLPYFIDSFPAFAWVLNALEAEPDRFDEEGCLWLYKWMATAAYSYADTPYAEVEKIFSDMKNRILANGYSLRGYYSTLIYWEALRGDIDSAARYLEIQKKEEKDILSDESDFELDTQIEMALLQGDFDQAVYLSEQFPESSKGFFPFATYSYMTYYLNKAGDERAERFYRQAEEALMDMEPNIKCIIDCVSCLISYTAVHDRKRAWELFETYSEWEVKSIDSMSFLFSKNVLSLLSRKEEVSLKLSPKHPCFKQDSIYNSEELYAYYYTKARDLAERFDKRNQTDYYKELFQQQVDISIDKSE